MTKLSQHDLWRLSLPALPLAFVALPLYVMWPHYFASRFGVSLGWVGAMLLVARVLDALLDPWLGHTADAWFGRGATTLQRRSWLMATVLCLGFWMLFFPHWLLGPALDWPSLITLVMLALIASYLGYSFLNIALQTWGARLGGDVHMRSQIVGWREGFGLAGVMLASLLPGVWGMEALVAAFGLLLALSMWGWWHAPHPAQTHVETNTPPLSGWQSLRQPWHQPGFRRLLLIYMINGIASAIPATLMLFFVEDRLQLPASMQSQFLGAYFLAATVSLPVWMQVMARWGLRRGWLAGMGLSVTVFIWALGLGPGDEMGYTVVCVLSGLALGADLIAPGAMLNGLLQQHETQREHSGASFGWWQVATKLNLALAAGLALPLLDALGYAAGSRDAPALLALSWAYALLPCVLKLLAGMVLFLSAQRLQDLE